MKRVASHDVGMQIVATSMPGQSDVVISVRRSKRWTVVASVDNSGTRATGKWQGNLSVGIDNPLGLNDLFNVGYSQDLALPTRSRVRVAGMATTRCRGVTGRRPCRPTRTTISSRSPG